MLLLVLAAAAVSVWFGFDGLVPVVVWWCERGRRCNPVLVFALSEVRFVRLGPLRVYVGLTRLRRLEVFRDEVPAADFARLRRLLKAAVSTGDGLEDVETV